MTTRAPVLAIAAAGLLGLAVSSYLTLVHAVSAPLACAAGGPVNCERVLTSGFAVIAGTQVPTAAAGLAWFGVSTGLALVRLSRPRQALLSTLQLLWASAGLAVVLGLVFVEIVLLGAICAWCTVAHVLVLATFLAALSDEAWSFAPMSAASGPSR